MSTFPSLSTSIFCIICFNCSFVISATEVMPSMFLNVCCTISSNWSPLFRLYSTSFNSFSSFSIFFFIPPIFSFSSSRLIKSSVYISIYFSLVFFNFASSVISSFSYCSLSSFFLYIRLNSFTIRFMIFFLSFKISLKYSSNACMSSASSIVTAFGQLSTPFPLCPEQTQRI